MDAPRGFSRYLGIAERFLARGRVPALLIAVARKRSRLKLVKSDLRLLQELLVAWVRGEYRGLSRQALLSVIAALAYFLSPVDIVPDFIAQGVETQQALRELPAPRAERVQGS
ncbi:YkvA family protein [Pseudomonas aeruginosa]|uniref:YkvA family protein n=1 Tax=Pseudomonas aeruginosa TaxID=287 RepID=UPI000BB90847|nr:DUF1232 domain-containing protein [Pseudomonas aeruginosa]PCA47128.1 hypothetical protein CJU38_20335 [Pseudomonas aeruginosa]PCA53060.1 hypothetical protein CJU37_19955 [Pseudomonas aeruginosa]